MTTHLSREMYVFVDESKGAAQGRGENVVRYFARTFERPDQRHFQFLLHNLECERAWQWHASESGQMSLLKSERVRHVLKNLMRSRSRLFGFTRQERQIHSEEILRQVGRIPEHIFEGQRDMWPSDNPQATMLLWSIFSTMSMMRWSHEPIRKPSRITFFTDRMPWVSNPEASRNSIEELPGMYLALGPLDYNGIELQICSAVQQDLVPKWIGSLLGLIDSECWIDARMGKVRAEGGLSIDEQGVQFSFLEGEAAEKFQIDASVVPRALERDATLSTPLGKLARRLTLYYSYWLRWIAEDRIVFNGVFPSTVIGGTVPTRLNW